MNEVMASIGASELSAKLARPGHRVCDAAENIEQFSLLILSPVFFPWPERFGVVLRRDRDHQPIEEQYVGHKRLRLQVVVDRVATPELWAHAHPPAAEP